MFQAVWRVAVLALFRVETAVATRRHPLFNGTCIRTGTPLVWALTF